MSKRIASERVAVAAATKKVRLEPDEQTTTAAEVSGPETADESQARRTLIYHWYPEPYTLRRYVKGTFSAPTLKEIIGQEASNDDSEQVKLLRDTFSSGALNAELWDKIGYITARDDKPVLQSDTASLPPQNESTNDGDDENIEKDRFGIPLDHTRYPLVARSSNGRWFLLCSWMDKCRCHHANLFCEDAHDLKRRVCDVPGRVDQHIQWETLIYTEATKRFKTEISPICNDVTALESFVLPADVIPAEAAGKTLLDAFPGHSQLRNIWHTPVGSGDVRGLCSLVPTSKLSGAFGGKFYAVEVVCGKDKNWVPLQELVEIAIEDVQNVLMRCACVNLSVECKGEVSKVGELHRMLPDFVSPPKGKACKIDRIVVVPDASNYTMSAYQMWPTAEMIRSSEYAPLDQITVVRIVHGRIMRAVFRKRGIVMDRKTIVDMEEVVKLDVRCGTLSIGCGAFDGAMVVVECYSKVDPFPQNGGGGGSEYPSVVAFKSNDDNDNNVDENDGEKKCEKVEIKPSFTYSSSYYCRCDFTLLSDCNITTVRLFSQ